MEDFQERDQKGCNLPSPEQLQNISTLARLMGSLAAQNKLVNQGNRVEYEGQ